MAAAEAVLERIVWSSAAIDRTCESNSLFETEVEMAPVVLVQAKTTPSAASAEPFRTASVSMYSSDEAVT